MSTSDAIINTLQYIYDNLDKGYSVISIFLDFSKAFDCVDHEILLHKLRVYGVRGLALDWFRSYLTNRQQYVTFKNKLSDVRSVDCGVPQGSILGPLLFLIFINDFPNCSNFFKFTLFADDSTLTCRFENDATTSIPTILSNELSNVFKWISANKLKVNTEKCKFIHFSYRQNLNFPPIKINSSSIYQTDSIKFLGIIIDKNLNFKQHITVMSSKLSKSVGLLHRLKHYLPEEIMKKLYYSLIHPYLNYGIESWHGASQSAVSGVHVLQKKVIRAVFNLDFNAHTNQHFKQSFILKCKELYTFNLSSHLYKLLKNRNNDYLAQYLRSYSELHNHNTRNNSSLIIPRFNLSTSQNSFVYQSIKSWNSLPLTIQKSSSICTFNSKLKKYYSAQY